MGAQDGLSGLSGLSALIGGKLVLAPDQISGLVGWWRADQGVWQDTDGTTPATDGSDVYRWDDQSGNGRNVIADWPYGDYEKFVASDAGLNNRAAIEFRVIGRGLYYDGAWAPATGAGERTVVVVGRNFQGHNLSSLGHMVHWGSQATNQAYGICGKIDGSLQFGNHYWTNTWAPFSNDQGAHIVMAAYDGTTDYCWLDGGTPATNTITLNTGSAEKFRIGSRIHTYGAEFGYGFYAEIVIYNRFLSDSERKGLLNYLSDRYGIALAS